MSATLRYARILKGLSPLISRRSAISPRMWAMAALSNPKTFCLDVKVQHAGPALCQRGGNGGSSVRRPVAKQAAAAAGAAHLRRGCAGGPSATHEIVDLRRRDAGRQPFSVLPFGGNLAAHLIPVAPFEGVTHRHSGIP